MQAFDVTWGDAEGDVVIENSYANVSRAVMTRGGFADGRLGRRSRWVTHAVTAARKSMRAFASSDALWPTCSMPSISRITRSDGTLSGEFHVYGPYTRPFGFGRMTIADGTRVRRTLLRRRQRACASKAAASVSMPSRSQRAPAAMTGAAYVGWNGTYSFNADGRGLAVETLDVAAFPDLPPLTGLLEFSAGGSGDVRRASLRRQDRRAGSVLRRRRRRRGYRRASRSATSCSPTSSKRHRRGWPSLAPDALRSTMTGDAELSFRVSDTSLDPYVRVFKPDLSPYTTAVASGTIRVVGELYNRDALAHRDHRSSSSISGWSTTGLRNQGPIQLAVEGQTLRLDNFRLVGDDTALDVAGTVDLPRQALVAAGERRRQPGGAAGLHARPAQLRSRRRLGAHRRHGGPADRLGPGDADRGTAAPLLVSSRARGPEWRRHVQRFGHPAR